MNRYPTWQLSLTLGAALLSATAAADEPKLEQVRALEKRAAAIRGLEYKTPVNVEWRTKKELAERLETMLDRDMTAEDFGSIEALLQHLELMPTGAKLRETYIAMLRENVAGFYDPKDATLWIIGDAGPGDSGAAGNSDESTVIHELIHALEDQHFDLEAIDESAKDQDDRMLAIHGLIEGSATYGMMIPMLGGNDSVRGNQRRILFRGLSFVMDASMALAPADDTPGFLKASLTYPYTAGLNFVSAVAGDRSYTETVDATYDDLPSSTEQVLHPERYLAADRDEPVVVILPDVTTELGEGWEMLLENTMGELQTRLAFQEWLVDRPTAGLLEALPEGARGFGKLAARLGGRLIKALDPIRAADGWGGDRYALYRHTDGQTAFVWDTTWDTEADASEFAGAYRRALRLRNRSRSSVEVRLDGTRVTILDAVPAEARDRVRKALDAVE